MVVASEIRHALRALRRAPWYTATVISVVALSVVMMATIFAVVDGVLFRPLPYPNPHDLFAISGTFEGEDTPPRLVGMVSPREVSTWRESVPDVPMTLVGYSSISLEDGSFALAATIDREFFHVFGVRLLAGGFDDADFGAEQPVRPLVISHRLWTTAFNGDPAIIGRTVAPHGFRTAPYRIAGVLDPDGFVPPLPGQADSWVRRASKIDALFPYTLPPTFGERIGVAFARVDAARARATESVLGSAVAAYRATVPPPQRPFISPAQRRSRAPYDGARLMPVADLVTARQRPIFAIVFATGLGLTLLVLLNAGALAAARSQHRLRELALRRSLGARTRDLMRGELLEQGLLTAGGAALGLALAPSLVTLVVRALPPGLEVVKHVRVDWRAAALVAVLSAVMAVVVASLSVRFAVRHAALSPMLAVGAGAGRAGAALGRLLVSAQIALGFVLVLGGALFVRSLGFVWDEDPGLRLRDAATLRVSFADMIAPARQQQVVDGVRALPGVAQAGAFDTSILENFATSYVTFLGPDGAAPPDPQPRAIRVGSGFFEAAGIRLVSGRFPSDAELDSGAPVIVVSETLAMRYWPGQHAVGQTLRSGLRSENRVVGVVREARLVSLDAAPTGTIFSALTQPGAGMRLFVAFSDEPELGLARLIARVPDIDPLARVSEARMIEDVAAESIRTRTLSAIAASGFAVGSLVVIAIGLFGLAAQITGWRTREMGIRLALGDTPAGIVRREAAGHAVTVLAGLAAGGVLAAAVVRLVSSYLYGLTAYDAATWTLTGSIVFVAAAAGALVPALRASRVNPIEALRAE